MVKHTYMVNGEFMIQMETSSNDSLMVVCDDDFFVCDRCGYAISSTAGKDEKDFNSYAKSYEKPHYSPWGNHVLENFTKEIYAIPSRRM